MLQLCSCLQDERLFGTVTVTQKLTLQNSEKILQDDLSFCKILPEPCKTFQVYPLVSIEDTNFMMKNLPMKLFEVEENMSEI